MNRLTSFLAAAALTLTGAEHEMTTQESMHMVDVLSTFFDEFEHAYATFEVSGLPTCVNNSDVYAAAYASKGCATVDCSTNAQTVSDECCFGTQKWMTMEQGCQNWQGFDSQDCCFECVDSSSPGYPFECSTDPSRIVGSILCDASPLNSATTPLPAGVVCDSEDVVVDGKFVMNGNEQSAPSCKDLLDKVFDDDASGQEVFGMFDTVPDFQGMHMSGSLMFRPVIVNGKVTFTNESRCNIMLSPRVNGELEVNPSGIPFPEDEGPETILYNATIYSTSNTATFKEGIYMVLEGKNWGSMEFDTWKMVNIGKFDNYGSIRVRRSKEFSMLHTSNVGMIDLENVEGAVHDVHNGAGGSLTINNGEVVASNITNEGSILVKNGTRCILDIYKNNGTITFEDGVTCKVYVNVNEHSSLGSLVLPSTGVTVIQGKYVPPIKVPLAEQFGRWTTGAYRMGKKRFVGDNNIDHGDCTTLRYATLAIKSVIQSPSNRSLNAMIEMAHLRRRVHVDMSYVNVTLQDTSGTKHHYTRYLFEDSDIITHLELPMANDNGFVTSSSDNFRFILSLDFDDLDIPKSMKNTVEINVFSLRQAKWDVRMDTEDCVKLVDVGVVHV